jgi:hypothetical protein
MINVRKNCLVLRVEDALGNGPYRNNYIEYVLYHNNSTAHPGPRDEGFDSYLNYDMYFCFTGKSQLKRWFSPFIRAKLDCDNFVCNVYYTKKCYYSKYQALFAKAEATLVDSSVLTLL